MNRASVILKTQKDKQNKLRPVPIEAIKFTDKFWAPKLIRNREITIRDQYQHLVDTGRIANFTRASDTPQRPHMGLVFNDSDVYKWLEAASWILVNSDDTELDAIVDSVIEAIAKAQGDDGYLNTYFMLEHAEERWGNLRDQHELYCAGHLFQAAVAHHRCTGKTTLLDIATRFADLICDTFGNDDGQLQGVPGHPEIEMGLVELARETSNKRYLTQATYFVNARGHGLIGGGGYNQDHLPLRDMPRLTGHAVRAAYLGAGATDLALAAGDNTLTNPLNHLWEHMNASQLYINGGLGGRHQGEAIGDDYEIPNARAYNETCAGIANGMWSYRMLHLQPDARYADMVERVLYNGLLPALSADGRAYFYANPLAYDGNPDPSQTGHTGPKRQPWFRCACCPPNIARTLAMIPGMMYSVDMQDVWVHQYAASVANFTMPDGREVQFTQRTRYPWDGNIFIDVLGDGDFGINLRIPGWATPEGTSVKVNGSEMCTPCEPGSYLNLQRDWHAGDSVCLRFDMPVQRISAHPYALENSGRIALMRGPILYCVEGIDHPGIDLRDIIVDNTTQLKAEFIPDFLGGMTLIKGQAKAQVLDATWHTQLYNAHKPANIVPIEFTAIPYFAWANREPGQMQVWLLSQ